VNSVAGLRMTQRLTRRDVRRFVCILSRRFDYHPILPYSQDQIWHSFLSEDL